MDERKKSEIRTANWRDLLLRIFIPLVLVTCFVLGILLYPKLLPWAPSTLYLQNTLAPEPDILETVEDNSPSLETPFISNTPKAEPVEPTGIWISRQQLSSLPTDGSAWEQLKAAADRPAGEPDLSDQVSMNDVYVLAKALVYARTGESKYRDEVIENLLWAMNTEDDGSTLALGRNLVSYVIAADLVDLRLDAEKDRHFRGWIRRALTKTLNNRTLQSTHEQRANNWGTHAGASRAAVAIYLGDTAEIARTAQVFKGWLGERRAYAGFKYGELSWQADPNAPVGINPKGAMKEAVSIDGALPEEMRRGGKFRWPPIKTRYAWEALQGALVQAELLFRVGYPTWEWEDRAILRAVQFLYNIGWEPEGDDQWQPWLINYVYGTDFPVTTPARPGKNMGWTNWTHSGERTRTGGD